MPRRAVQDSLPFMADYERETLTVALTAKLQEAQDDAALWREQATALRAALTQAQLDCAQAQLQASRAELHRLQAERALAEYRDTNAAFHRWAERQGCTPLELFLREELASGTPAHTASGVRRQVTRLIAVAHPDKWDNHPCADALTKALLAFRETLA